MQKFLSIDVGGTNIKYALMQEDTFIVEKGEIPTPKTNLEDFVQILCDLYEKYEEEGLEAIVMAAPGRIDNVNGYFYTGGALPYLYEVDMKGILEDRIPIPFAVVNDAKAAASAELTRGSMQGIQTGSVLTLGTGIGGSVIINGKVHNGPTGAAGEFSGIPSVWAKRVDCTEPCWADVNGVGALLKYYGKEKGIDPHSINGRIFFEAVNRKEPEALKALEEYTSILAGGLYMLQFVLDCERIAIGGGISAQPALIQSLNDSMDRLFEHVPSFFPVNRPEIVVCQHRNDANLIGALENYFLITQD